MSHQVTLGWQASSDAGLAGFQGYNVYRGSSAAAITTKLTPTPITALVFTDSSAVEGDEWYAVTSVVNGVESLPSVSVESVILPAAPTGLAITSQS